MFPIEVSLVFAFSAGFVAAFNPCGAVMFPAYIGYQLDTFRAADNLFRSTIQGIILGFAFMTVKE